MTGRSDRAYIEDILESIGRIEAYTGQRSLEDFLSDSQMQDAVARRLEIIGEAVKNISVELREQHPAIPWRQIAGLRDVLILWLCNCQYATCLECGDARLALFEKSDINHQRYPLRNCIIL